MQLTNKELKIIFSFADKEIVLLLIELINFTQKEKRTLMYYYIDDYTIEQTAELMQCSERTISSLLKKIQKKAIKVFENNIVAQTIIKNNS